MRNRHGSIDACCRQRLSRVVVLVAASDPRCAADAGFHAVAPDMRGYGQTDRPVVVEAYDIFQLTGDLVGLVNALGAEPVVIVGHDWGAGSR